MRLRGRDNGTAGYTLDELGPITADRPAFVVPDPVFNPGLSGHCAFPSLPVSHDGLGPSEAMKEKLAEQEAARKRAAATLVVDCGGDSSSSNSSGSESDGGGDGGGGGSKHAKKMAACNNSGGFEVGKLAQRLLSGASRSKGHQGEKPSSFASRVSAGFAARQATRGPREERLELVVLNVAFKTSIDAKGGEGLHQVGHSARHRLKISRRDNGDKLVCFALQRPVWMDGQAWKWSLSQEMKKRGENNSLHGGRMSMVAKPCDWAGLTDGVKFMILHELIANDGLSFTAATKLIGLTCQEATQACSLVEWEEAKRARYAALVGRKVHDVADMTRPGPKMCTAVSLWLDAVVKEATKEDNEETTQTSKLMASVTDKIKDSEMLRGQMFVAFLGLSDLARRLGEYIGTSMGFYEVPISHYISQGWSGLPLPFNVAFEDELEVMRAADERASREAAEAQRRGEEQKNKSLQVLGNPLTVEEIQELGLINPQLMAADVDKDMSMDCNGRLVPASGSVAHTLHEDDEVSAKKDAQGGLFMPITEASEDDKSQEQHSTEQRLAQAAPQARNVKQQVRSQEQVCPENNRQACTEGAMMAATVPEDLDQGARDEQAAKTAASQTAFKAADEPAPEGQAPLDPLPAVNPSSDPAFSVQPASDTLAKTVTDIRSRYPKGLAEKVDQKKPAPRRFPLDITTTDPPDMQSQALGAPGSRLRNNKRIDFAALDDYSWDESSSEYDEQEAAAATATVADTAPAQPRPRKSGGGRERGSRRTKREDEDHEWKASRKRKRRSQPSEAREEEQAPSQEDQGAPQQQPQQQHPDSNTEGGEQPPPSKRVRKSKTREEKEPAKENSAEESEDSEVDIQISPTPAHRKIKDIKIKQVPVTILGRPVPRIPTVPLDPSTKVGAAILTNPMILAMRGEGRTRPSTTSPAMAPFVAGTAAPTTVRSHAPRLTTRPLASSFGPSLGPYLALVPPPTTLLPSPIPLKSRLLKKAGLGPSGRVGTPKPKAAGPSSVPLPSQQQKQGERQQEVRPQRKLPPPALQRRILSAQKQRLAAMGADAPRKLKAPQTSQASQMPPELQAPHQLAAGRPSGDGKVSPHFARQLKNWQKTHAAEAQKQRKQLQQTMEQQERLRQWTQQQQGTQGELGRHKMPEGLPETYQSLSQWYGQQHEKLRQQQQRQQQQQQQQQQQKISQKTSVPPAAKHLTDHVPLNQSPHAVETAGARKYILVPASMPTPENWETVPAELMPFANTRYSNRLLPTGAGSSNSTMATGAAQDSAAPISRPATAGLEQQKQQRQQQRRQKAEASSGVSLAAPTIATAPARPMQTKMTKDPKRPRGLAKPSAESEKQPSAVIGVTPVRAGKRSRHDEGSTDPAPPAKKREKEASMQAGGERGGNEARQGEEPRLLQVGKGGGAGEG